MGTNVSTTFITCPSDPKKTLGIKLPFLVMIIKNVRFLQVKKVFYFRGASTWRQKRQEKVPSIQLPVNNPRETFYLHYADEAWWGLEPNPVQPFRLHP